jgi:hypothetical protein
MNVFGNIAAEVPISGGEITFVGWYQVNEHAGGTLSLAPH